ncbi:50S ribosomal protein L4 [Luteolibacter pohnpeiensis]|uniref:Large ribosomal subunit protein uL4 n=1 Tax=Luteolibacter pohnpeiensis TaxID=454153 RepID=A0A934SAW1_9BACT|nr:50S ribosomal protein L4 [Luteolibacter pohnpeiensis]MBK1882822.1 50S ribosomal protein L4 [Luteolibacter pohnpeiensis]
MSAKTFTEADAQAANITLVGPERGRQAVHDLVTAYRANRRTGSANTKTRGEVSGNNKKIYKQKGTGNARHGDKRAPIFVGGGVVFGPRPRDYSKKVPKTVRKLALRRVLGDLVRDEKIVTVDSFAIEDGKTKSFVAAVSAITPNDKVVIVGNNFDDATRRAARNVGWTQLVSGSDLNVEELLLAKTVILVGDAVSTLAFRTA